MADVQEQILATLTEILGELKRIRGASEASALHFGVKPRSAGGGGAAASQQGRGQVAPDRDLDGSYGDPKVIVDPRNWQGASFKGGRMSEAPPDFLDELAEVLDDFADGEADPKKAKYKRGDAAKARGWARRKRAEEQRAQQSNGAAGASDEDFP